MLRREARRVTREASARVSALRAQNYEEYLRLATHAKDSRLRTLLEKTDTILSDLGHKVLNLPKSSLKRPIDHLQKGSIQKARNSANATRTSTNPPVMLFMLKFP